MSAVSPNAVSDTKLIAATGKPRGEWHALLDDEGAASWEHPEIATWLQREHHVDGWWAQGIAIGYEQARGLRIPGQQSGGLFAASASRTLEGSAREVLDHAIATLSDLVDVRPASVSHEAKHPSARWALRDGTSLRALVSPAPVGTVHRVRLVLTREKMPEPSGLEAAKAQLVAMLDRVSGVLD